MNELRQVIRKLRVIHVAIALGIAILSAIAHFFYKKNGVLLQEGFNEINWEYGIMVSLAVLLLAGQWYYRKSLKGIQSETLLEKLQAYTKVQIILYASIELGSIIALVGFVMTGLNNLFLYNMIFILYLLYNRPHIIKIKRDLKLSDDEVAELKQVF
ncbi:MAG: hypothetical protein JXR19_01460 [Bacteroidia bacterium]